MVVALARVVEPGVRVRLGIALAVEGVPGGLEVQAGEGVVGAAGVLLGVVEDILVPETADGEEVGRGGVGVVEGGGGGGCGGVEESGEVGAGDLSDARAFAGYDAFLDFGCGSGFASCERLHDFGVDGGFLGAGALLFPLLLESALSCCCSFGGVALFSLGFGFPTTSFVLLDLFAVFLLVAQQLLLGGLAVVLVALHEVECEVFNLLQVVVVGAEVGEVILGHVEDGLDAAAHIDFALNCKIAEECRAESALTEGLVALNVRALGRTFAKDVADTVRTHGVVALGIDEKLHVGVQISHALAYWAKVIRDCCRRLGIGPTDGVVVVFSRHGC